MWWYRGREVLIGRACGTHSSWRDDRISGRVWTSMGMDQEGEQSPHKYWSLGGGTLGLVIQDTMDSV